MICPYCGNGNPENNSQCDYCGGSLVIADEPKSAETLPTEPDIPLYQPAADLESKFPEPAPIPDQPSRGRSGVRIGCLVVSMVFICLILGLAAVVWGFFRNTNVLGFLRPTTSTPSFTPGSFPNTTPLYTSTSIPNPILVNPDLLYFDDFSDPDSGWDRVNETDRVTDYYHDTYRITLKKDMFDVWANPGDQTFGDVTVEVDATKNGGSDDNDFGVICRYQEIEQFYYGVITSDGYYAIIKVTSDGSTSLGRDNYGQSDLINQGDASNHIRFDCTGDKLSLYVNGNLLDQQTDGDYASGNVGLIAGSYNDPLVDILFDDFFVLQP